MSTTTSIKRIALVAVAAMGFGMLSVIPSNAAVVANTLTIDSATDSITLGETATAVLTHGFVTTNASDSVTITAIKTSANSATAGTIQFRPTDSSTSTGITDRPEYSYVKAANVTTDNASATALWVASASSSGFPDSLTVSNNNANVSVNSTFGVNLVNPQAAGTYVVTFYMQVSNNGAAATVSTTSVTWTVTVAAADTTAVGSSTSVLRAGNAGVTWGDGTSATADSSVAVSRSATRTTPDGIIKITQRNAAGTELTGGTVPAMRGESMTVTVSGGTAFLTTGTSADAAATTRPTTGVVSATLANGSDQRVFVWSNGTAGTATITTTTFSGLLIGTETITFTGPVTGLAVTKSYNSMTAYGSIVRSGGRTSGNLVEITATDSAARPVGGLTLSCVSGTATVITGCTVTASTDYPGEYYLAFTSASNSTSGQKATVTVRVVDPAVTTSTAYLTTTVDLTLGSTIATEAITFDKENYSPGEGMVITRTAKDASGNPVFDGATGVALTANKSLGGSAITACTYYAGTCSTSTMALGKELVKFTTFAPAAPGAFTVSGLGGLLGGVLISGTATVTDDAATAAASAAGDAAAEATDAANAATDAANAAAEAADAATAAAQDAADAVAALSTSVTAMVDALRKQITSLTNLVIKIQRKVRA
jgi:trimeric autotransporter adhesin